MQDNLLLFLYYCQYGLTEEAELILENLITIDENQWEDFNIAVNVVTYKSIQYNMSPYLYLILYRLSYDEIIIPIKE